MRVILSSIVLCLGLNAIEMPPMPPMMDLKPKDIKETKSKKESKQISSTPKECELLPPMVIMLPPPMEDMVGKCKNELLKPKIEGNKNIEKLFGKNVKIDSLLTVEGFNNLYELKVLNKFYLCNKEISQCFEKGKLLK